MKMASTLSDDTAPSASLDHLEARAAPTHPRALPEPLGGIPWPQELASGRPKVEDVPFSTTRYWVEKRLRGRAGVAQNRGSGTFDLAHAVDEWKGAAARATGSDFAATQNDSMPAWRATLKRLNRRLKECFDDG